jgi:DNA-binding response OmpR family regulator
MNADCLEGPQPVAPPVATRSVLIIDDDLALLETLAFRLRQQGFEVLTCTTGHVGLALARREQPDVVILDIRLPDLDGLVVCQKLCDSRHTCGIPVIILSGVEGPHIVRRSRAAGCRYFLRKPYDPNALLALIETALQDEVG